MKTMEKYIQLCRKAIEKKQPRKMLDNVTNIIRYVYRVLLVAQKEIQGYNDPERINKVKKKVLRLEITLTIMQEDAQLIAKYITLPDINIIWKATSKNLLDAVEGVHQVILDSLPIKLDTEAPPPPSEPVVDENKSIDLIPYSIRRFLFTAYDLELEIVEWMLNSNEIRDNIQRIKVLTDEMLQLRRCSPMVNIRQLIETAKEIAIISKDVTRLAKILTKQCNYLNIRTNLLQICDRITTIGTQLKIISSVKTIISEAQILKEDIEATEMLVVNVQNLMRSFDEITSVIEATNIKFWAYMAWIRKQSLNKY